MVSGTWSPADGYCPGFPTTAGEAAERIGHGVDPLTELVNQLLIAQTLTAFEEKGARVSAEGA
ncbi:MAG: hypothetical protein U0175_36565 [Caldilineaceae bacterium]